MSAPDIDDWIRDVKSQPGSAAIGMILAHQGIVRGTSRSGEPVTGMSLSADLTRFEEVLAEAGTWPGIFAVRGWVNEGELSVGDDIMRLVVAGDIREHVFEGLQRLVSLIKTEVVGEVRTRLRRRHDMYACAECGRAACCESPDAASYPRGCPSREPFESEVLGLYQEGEDAHLARNAGLVEAHGYCRLTRIEEIMDFARRCGYSKLGLAFCIGLQAEAAVTSRVLRANGFSVDSVACKNGSLPKEVLGLGDEDKVHAGGVREHVQPARTGARPGPGGDRAQSAARSLRRSRQPVHEALGGAGDRARRQGQGAGPQPAGGDLHGGRLLLRQAVPEGRRRGRGRRLTRSPAGTGPLSLRRPVYFASSRRSPRCRNVVSLTRSVQPPRVPTRRSNFST